MTLKTHTPSGLPPWPIVLLAGEQYAGKSFEAAAFSASEHIGRTFWFEIGETSAEQYGAIPGARYEIVEHDGTYRGIKLGIQDAVAEPQVDGKPNCIVIDTIGKVWELLSDEAQVMAYRREVAKAARRKLPAPDPDADFTVGPDLWNRANNRWYDVLDLLKAFPGPVILLSRLKETTVMDAAGQPTKDKVWKAKAQGQLAYDVDVVIEGRGHRDWYLTKVRSLTYKLPADGIVRLPDFSIEKVMVGLGVTKQAGPRQAVALDPAAVDPVRQPAPVAKPLPDDFADRVAAAANRYDKAQLMELHGLAQAAGNQVEVARVAAAGKRVSAALDKARKQYNTGGVVNDDATLAEYLLADEAEQARAGAQ